MSAIPSDLSTALAFRSGTSEDWAAVAHIVASTWEGHDYLDQALWNRWVADPEDGLRIALLDEQVVGFAKLSHFGPAEWWLQGLRVDPAYHKKGFARALNRHILQLFREVGDGMLRFTTGSMNEAMRKIASESGFRHIMSYVRIEAPARPADFSNLRLLASSHLSMVLRYLRSSPMHRVNRFAERHWMLHFLTEERLAAYLGGEAHVTGWRQFDQLHGLAIHFPDNSQPVTADSDFVAGYLDAPDDTTLLAMLDSIRGLAAQRGYGKVVWKMPTGVGLRRSIDKTDFIDSWEDGMELWLYELPIQVHLDL